MKTFFEWVEKTFTVDYRKEIDDYLADAVSHYDLEQRMKTLMRKGMI
jgi:hypothetical protein